MRRPAAVCWCMHHATLRPLAAGAAAIALSLLPVTPASRLAAQAAGGQTTTLVTVDFRALGPDGTPVADLRPEEVSLKVGGRVREILALQFVQAEPRPEADAQPAPPPPFVTNAPPIGGRNFVLLIDEEGIPTGKDAVVRAALGHLIAALSPADRLSVRTSKGGAVQVLPTLRHDRVLEALKGLVGRAQRGETAPEVVCRSRLNLFALVDVLSSVVPSGPTVVVFVTNGFTPPTVIENIARGQGPPGPCELMPRDLDTLATAAAASRAQLFVLQVIDDGLSAKAVAGEMTRGAERVAPPGGAAAVAVAETHEMSGGLEHVAGLTGNAIIRLIGDASEPMRRIARETSAHYLAAFEVAASERTGSTQRVEVTVSRPDVELRTVPSVLIPKPASAGSKPGTRSAQTPRDLLSVARSAYDLPLRASVYLSRASSDGRLRVVALFESADPSARISAAAAALFDAQSKARAVWTAQPAELSRQPVLTALTVPGPGTYRLRVAATDTAGLGGTLDEEVTVPATAKDTVWVGALVLGVQAGQSFAPRLEFHDEEVAVGMVEIAGLSKTAVVAATFELAGSADGPALATLPGSVRTSNDGSAVAFLGIPIGQMPPGDVVVRAVITVDGQPVAARPVRTLRKVAQ